MIREEVFNPLAGPIGALGISSETSADVGKERRTATKAPPGEMLIAVANSRESLSIPSRVRIKTGMASCNRAHLRCSFFNKLRRTCLLHHKEVFTPQRPHLMGQTRRGMETVGNRSKPRSQQGDYRGNFTSPVFYNDCKSCHESAIFFASVAFEAISN